MENEQRLGVRVLVLYLCKNLMIGIGLLILSFVLMSFQDAVASRSFGSFSLGTMGPTLNLLIEASFVASLFALLIGAEISWLFYVDCTFSIGEDAFTIKRGILSKTQISIPYRQIQDVYLNQSLLHRILGVSKIVILTAGNDIHEKEDESEGIFEMIDSAVARKLKETILERSNIQKVIDVTK